MSACRRQGYELLVADVMANPTIQMRAKRLSPLKPTDSTVYLADTKYAFEDDVYKELNAAGIERDAVEAAYPCIPGQAEFLTQGRTKHHFWQLMTVRKSSSNFDLQRWTELLRPSPQGTNSFVRSFSSCKAKKIRNGCKQS